ncbi:hypothetical protein MHBO_001207 [Bonamia ostreae]|uniref:Uncharacterized protein n=1 Tax=Bonamia ostreae TaxID=126728 RepID=A0ABV2AI53_9EUKA
MANINKVEKKKAESLEHCFQRLLIHERVVWESKMALLRVLIWKTIGGLSRTFISIKRRPFVAAIASSMALLMSPLVLSVSILVSFCALCTSGLLIGLVLLFAPLMALLVVVTAIVLLCSVASASTMLFLMRSIAFLSKKIVRRGEKFGSEIAVVRN